MAVSQKAAPLPVNSDSEEVRPSRNPVGLQVSKPDSLASNPVLDTSKPFQSPSTSTPLHGSDDIQPVSHNEREHQDVNQQRVKGLIRQMKELEETVKELKYGSSRRESFLKSKIAALEKKVEQNDGTTMHLEVNESWATFRNNLYNLFRKLRPGDMTAEADDIDSKLIQEFKIIYDRIHANLGHTYQTCIAGSEEVYRKELQDLTENFMVQLWKGGNVFQTDCVVSQVLFFLIANQVYRINGECNTCPLCGNKKEYRRNYKEEGDPNSHIFPESLLEVYRQVHCEGIGNFIWDMALSDKYGARKLTVKLLCQKCESSDSHAEGKLRDLYVCILSHPNNRIEVPNEREWLSFVFTNIMFRGLVINVNLMNEIRNGRFGSIESLLSLRRYCMESESVKPPPLYLSVLPSGPFRPELSDTTYIFDLQLRNPEFASVIDESFVYTKFDCFHCRLPFGDHSLDFDNVLDSKTIPSEEERKHLFPQVLLRRNLKEALQLAEYIISRSPNSKLDHHCKVFIEREPGIRPQYSESMDWHKESVQETSSEATYQFKGYKEEERKALVEEAAQASPLKAVVGQDKLQREIAKLQERNCNLQAELDKKKQELKETRKELDKSVTEKKAAERQRRAAELEKDNLRGMYEQECRELERRIEQLEKDNQELECQLNLVMPAQVEEEAEESMHNGLVTHEFIPEEPTTND